MQRSCLSVMLLAVVTACSPSLPGTKAPKFSIHLSDSAVQQIVELGLEVPIAGRAYVIISSDSES
jgi:hypothetical protein